MAHPVFQAVADRYDYLDGMIRRGSLSLPAAIAKYAWVDKRGNLSLAHLDSAHPEAIGEFSDDEAIIPFTVSVLEEDRDGDIVVPLGCYLKNYARNPLWFLGHQEHIIPIGSAKDASGRLMVWPTEDRIRAACRFDMEDPDAHFLHGKVQRGFLNATSIAFVPLEATRRDGEYEKARVHGEHATGVPPGWLFKKYDLTEISIVGVPSNAGAIRDALDSEKSFISPRLQKSLGAYAAQPKGRCWSGWCPPCKSLRCGVNNAEAVEKSAATSSLTKQSPSRSVLGRVTVKRCAAASSPRKVCWYLVKGKLEPWYNDSPLSLQKYIRHEGGKWVVHAESGKVLGRHDTKEDAERQLRAVEANKGLAGIPEEEEDKGRGQTPSSSSLTGYQVGDVVTARRDFTRRDPSGKTTLCARTGDRLTISGREGPQWQVRCPDGGYTYVGSTEIRREAPVGAEKTCDCDHCQQGKKCPCKGKKARKDMAQGAPLLGTPVQGDIESNNAGVKYTGSKAQPSDEISPDKACRILEDGSVNGHPLTDDQKRLFGAACGRKKGLTPREKQLVKQALTTTSGPSGGYTVAVEDGGKVQHNGGKGSRLSDTEAPGKEVCPVCDGSGNCGECGGTGLVGEAECPACEGSGNCPECNGKGVQMKGIPMGRTRKRVKASPMPPEAVEPTPETMPETPPPEEPTKGSEDMPFHPKPSARQLALTYRHLKDLDDYLTKILPEMDHPGVSASLQQFKEEHLPPAMDYLKSALSEHHPDAGDMEKLCKGMETDGAGPVEATGEANLTDAGQMPPDSVQAAEPFAGEETPEEEYLEGESHGEEVPFNDTTMTDTGEMLDTTDVPIEPESAPALPAQGMPPEEEPAMDDTATEEILERYQTPKGWQTRSIGTLRRAKDGRVFLVRSHGSVQKDPHLAYDHGYAHVVRGGAANGNPYSKMPGKTEEAREWEYGYKDAIKDGAFSSHPDYRSRSLSKQGDGEYIVGSGHSPDVDEGDEPAPYNKEIGEGVEAVKDAGEFLGDLSQAADVPKHYRVVSRQHAKRLGTVHKQLKWGLSNQGRTQANGARGAALSDEGKRESNDGSGTPLSEQGRRQRDSQSRQQIVGSGKPDFEKQLSGTVVDRFNDFARKFRQLTGIDVSD